MNKNLFIIAEIVAIVFGILAIIKIVGNPDIIVSLMSLSFGVLAIIWTVIAMTSLSKGSSLRGYVILFLLALIFILLFSIWHMLVIVYGWKNILIYPEYFFISIAYITFVIASYKVYKLGKEFGFKEKSAEISKSLKKTK